MLREGIEAAIGLQAPGLEEWYMVVSFAQDVLRHEQHIPEPIAAELDRLLSLRAPEGHCSIWTRLFTALC